MSSEGLEARRILLVEDEAIVALSEKHTIEQHGFTVETVHSGEEAVRATQEDQSISLVLMDIDLGSGIDGTEAARQILQMRQLPIVFLTGHAEREYVERVKRITSYGYVLKDAGEFVLIESIEMAFNLFDAHREVAVKEQSLSHIVEEAPVGIFQTARGRTFRRMNQEMAHILGFADPEDAREHYTDIASELFVDPNRYRTFLALLKSQATVRDFRFAARTVSGEHIYLRMNAQVVSEDPRDGIVISAFVSDETKQRNAERELQRSHEEYRSVVELSQELIVRHDAEGRWTFLNDAACRFYGKSREELLGRHFMDYVHPEDRDDTRVAGTRMSEAFDPVQGLVNRNWTPGGWRVVEWNSAPIFDAHGAYVGHQAIGRDITEQTEIEEERRQTEAELRESEYLLAESQRIAHVGTWTYNRWKGQLTWSDEVYRIFGVDPASFRPTYAAFIEAIHPEDRDAVDHAYAASIEEQDQGYELEHRIVRQDTAEVRYVYEKCRHVLGDDGTVVESIGVVQDITERRRAEEARRESEARYRLLAENSSDIIASLDAELRPLYISPSCREVLGYSPDEFLERRIYDIMHGDDQKGFEDQVRSSIHAGRQRDTISFRLYTKAGELKWIEARHKYLYDGEGALRGAVTNLRDITERKRAERQLERSLEEEKRLMRELNHRVKNNLNMVSSLISLKAGVAGDRVDLSDLARQVDAIQKIHLQLHHSGHSTEVDLREYIEDLLASVFDSLTRRHITIDNHVEEVSLPSKTAVALGIIINEMATNAVQHGFEDGKEARFSVAFRCEQTCAEEGSGDRAAEGGSADRVAAKTDRSKGYWGVLTVTNSGKPFPEDTELENASTLGLQLISALAEQLGGTVDLQRYPHPTFTICFPMDPPAGHSAARAT